MALLKWSSWFVWQLVTWYLLRFFYGEVTCYFPTVITTEFKPRTGITFFFLHRNRRFNHSYGASNRWRAFKKWKGCMYLDCTEPINMNAIRTGKRIVWLFIIIRIFFLNTLWARLMTALRINQSRAERAQKGTTVIDSRT